jgi:hypothetical protein
MKKISINDLDTVVKAVEGKSVRMHLSRPATIKKDGMVGLTYTDNRKKASNVCVWYDVVYKQGDIDMIDEKNFHTDTYKTIDNAESKAYKYADKLSKKYKTKINYY